MSFKKGKQFESAVEMFDYFKDTTRTKIYVEDTLVDCDDLCLALTIEDVYSTFSKYSEAIKEKEDEIREFWLWDYCSNGLWERTLLFYDDNFKNSKGGFHLVMSELPDYKKLKVESSKIKINMATKEVVE